MMKYPCTVGAWLVGAVTGILCIAVFALWNGSAGHDGSVRINVENDSDIEFAQVVLDVESAQRFTCTLSHSRCSFIVTEFGDTNFELVAHAEGTSSISAHYKVGYAESGSVFSVKLSQFSSMALNDSLQLTAQSAGQLPSAIELER